MAIEIVKRPHAANFVNWAKDKPQVLLLSADLTGSCEADDFRDTYPDRFYSMGMAEQNMMGFAAGLAREGYFPFIHTFAVFICRRAFDQVAMSIAYPNLPVRLLGFLPGITTPGGVTHQAIDDVGLMRMIPNMTILECGDATDVESIPDLAQSVDGPVYVRMLRGEVPRLFAKDDPLRIDKVRLLGTDTDRSRTDTDIVVLSSGICTEEALRGIFWLRGQGVSVTHLHVSTLKPFSDPVIIETIASAKFGVIAMENHSVIGGLGSATAELMAEAGIGKKLVRLGIQDIYAHGASRGYLMKEYGIDAPAMVKAAAALLGADLSADESDLPAVAPLPGELNSKAEDL
jgi:transketolase